MSRMGLTLSVVLGCAVSHAQETWVPRLLSPTPRTLSVMAYDEVRRVIVLFGGDRWTATTATNADTWEYDGLTWSRQPPAPPGLTARAGHAMAWDGAAVVLFAGVDGNGYLQDTWEYDGGGWSQAATPSAPPPRAVHAMTWDRGRGRIVLFGGSMSGVYLSDTWEYDGSTWSSVAASGPSARFGHGMAYDDGRGVTVLYGGEVNFIPMEDTWEYDGAAWTRGPTSTVGNDGRSFHGMVYDQARGLVVLTGGRSDNTAAHNDTWEYDGTSWTLSGTPPALFSPRFFHSQAYDRQRAVTVVFGGTNGGADDLNDTWEYDGTWRVGGGVPPALQTKTHSGTAYDPVRDRVVLFGGGKGMPSDDTWEYDGAAWVSGGSAPLGLTPRSFPSLAFVSTVGSCILYGGSTAAGDSWYYDGAWVPGPTTPGGMSPRSQQGMAYDDARDRVVVFGGVDSTVELGDVWELDPSVGWSPGTTPPAGLTARASPGLVFDGSRIVLFGGRDNGGARDDTWYYDGAGWTSGPAAPAGLVARYGHGMALQPGLGVVVFGGQTGGGPSPTLADTWELRGASWVRGDLPGSSIWSRTFPMLATDTRRGRIVLFGGDDGNYTIADTWFYTDCSTIDIDPASLPDGVPGSPYQVSLIGSGGAAPYTFALLKGSLPPGLTLSPAGSISGTPATGGEYPFTVEATDASQCPGVRTYRIDICTVAVTPSTLPLASPGVAYQATLTASGGVPPYTFRVTSGTLPPGIQLTPSGDLGGTPTASGTFNFEITATDAVGCAGTVAYALVVCTPPSISPGQLEDGVVGLPYLQTFTASGGVPPHVFSALGNLPPGLQLSSWGVLTGAPSQAGQFSFQIAVTDSVGCQGIEPRTLVVEARASLVAGAGLGVSNPNWVRTMSADGASGVAFTAYTAGAWGVNVAAGRIEPGGVDGILTGPGPGGVYGPHVRAFRADASPILKVNYYAYGTLKFGVEVALADLDADGLDEFLTGAGPSPVFAPHVRGWNFDADSISSLARINFFGPGPQQFGVAVAAADLDADGYAEFLTGPGPGPSFSPTVRGWNYDDDRVSSLAGVTFNAYANAGYGVRVAAGDIDADSFAEMATAPGPGPNPSYPARFRGFDYDLTPVQILAGYDVTPFPSAYGGRLALGDFDPDGADDLLAGAGPDPTADSTLKSFTWDGVSLNPRAITILAFPGTVYGVSPGSGRLGY